jgi:membrane dipeptidase
MRAQPLLVFAVVAVAAAALPRAVPVDDVSPRARKLHFRAIVVDTHADTTQKLLFEPGYDFGERHTTGHVDLPRMRQVGLDALFFSIYIPTSVTGPEAVKRSLRLIDSVRETVRKHPADMALATRAADVRRAHQQGKIAALM